MFADDSDLTIQGKCARELETRLNPDLEKVKQRPIKQKALMMFKKMNDKAPNPYI